MDLWHRQKTDSQLLIDEQIANFRELLPEHAKIDRLDWMQFECTQIVSFFAAPRIFRMS